MNPFLRQPMSKRTPIRAEAPEPKVADGVATLRLYDPIDDWGGEWGISAKEFAGVLDQITDDVNEIRLLVNSPGGVVWEGLAILNALRAHPARVVAVVEGIAASAASFIAAGCDELVMAPNSEIFIHNAWGLCVGNAEDMQKMADDLNYEDRNIASIYAAKAGGTIDEWMAAMSAETFYSADDAVAVGLADRVSETSSAPTGAKNRWDCSIFNSSGRLAATGHKASATPPSPSPSPGQEGGSDVSDLNQFREALGLADTVSDDAIVAALATLPDPPLPDEPEKPVVAELPDGFVPVPQASLDEQAARIAELEKRETERAQAAFIAKHRAKVTPHEQPSVIEMLASIGEEKTEAIVTKWPDRLPLAQIGNGGGADLDVDDALYNQLFGTKETAR